MQEKFRFLFDFVGKTGFEPATPCSQSKCANRAALLPYLSGLSYHSLRYTERGEPLRL